MTAADQGEVAMFVAGLGILAMLWALVYAVHRLAARPVALPEPEPVSYTPTPGPDPILVVDRLMQTAVRRSIAVDQVGGVTLSIAWCYSSERWRAVYGTRGAYFVLVGSAGQWLLERVTQRVAS